MLSQKSEVAAEIEWSSEYLRASCNGHTLRAVKAIPHIDGPLLFWSNPTPPPPAKYDFNINIIRYEAMSRADFFRYNPKAAGVVKAFADCDGDTGRSHCSFTFNRYAGAHAHTLQSLMAAFGGQKYDLFNVDIHAKFGGKFQQAGKTQFIWEYARQYGYKSAYGSISRTFMGLEQQASL